MPCSNTKDCYSTTDPTGVSVADMVIANLKKKGHQVTEVTDISLEHPRMKIYEVKKEASKPTEYLHIVWGNGTGTRTLMLAKKVDDWNELASIAKL